MLCATKIKTDPCQWTIYDPSLVSHIDFFSLHFSLIFKVSFTSVHPYEEERSIALIIKFLIIIGIKFCFLCAQKANSTLRSICLLFHVRKGQWHLENLSSKS
jgi:hypothetical protein